MHNKLIKFLWLLALPLGALILSYIAIRLIDSTDYKPVIYALSILAIAMPVLSLAYFIKAIIKTQSNIRIVLSAFLSSLFWIVVSAVVNNKNTKEDSESMFTNGVYSLGIFTIGASLIMYLIQYVFSQIRKPKK